MILGRVGEMERTAGENAKVLGGGDRERRGNGAGLKVA